MPELFTMARWTRLVRTSVGRKAVVAVTGVVLIGFLIGHLLGNLTMLQGRQAMNAYADWLQGHPLLWVARIGLLTVFLAHVLTAIGLERANRAARPVAYSMAAKPREGRISRYILLTGLLILAFLIYHLLHLTFGVIQPENAGLVDNDGRHDVFAMTVRGFQNPLEAGSYVLAMVVLWFHLRHGATSLFQTLGISHAVYDSVLRGGAVLIVTLIVLGNITIPLLCLFGVVHE